MGRSLGIRREAVMIANPLVRPILHNEALTRGLGDPEARLLVEWLVEQVEGMRDTGRQTAQRAAQALCARGRAIGRFVRLWCIDGLPSAACQLAATERFRWPLPTCPVDPCDLM